MKIALAIVALAAGALAAVARTPEPAPAPDEISAAELATWIRDRQPGLLLVDLRPDATDRLPGAGPLTEADRGAVDTLVAYADRNVDPDAVEALHARRVLRLRGGVAAWNAEVLFPTLRADASGRQRLEFESRARLSRYFGGSPRVLDPGASPDRGRSRRGC